MESRRSFLAACAGAATAGLAGCIETRQRYNGDLRMLTTTIEQVDGIGATTERPILVSKQTERGTTTLVIEGLVTGRNGCFDDVALTTETDDEADTATLRVTPVRSDPERRFCTQALVPLGYRLTVKYEGTLDGLTVAHGGINSGTFDIGVNEEE